MAGRDERVLDAAAELLVRWGYRRVTIEDVAKHAHIGKGTVYLHFRTKEALFLTVLLRAHREVVEALAGFIDADPAAVLPSRMMRLLYSHLRADPTLHALYLGTGDVLGSLVREAVATLGDLAKRRAELMLGQLDALGAAGCLRAGTSGAEAWRILEAIGTGFFLVDGLAGREDDDPARTAELIEYAIAGAIEVPDPPAAALAAIAPAMAAQYRSLNEHIENDLRSRIR